MKTSHFLGIVLIFASLVLVLVAATFLPQSMVSTQNLGASALYAQITPTPGEDDTSVIGSTDGILIMGFVIMFIIITPVIIYKSKK